MIGIEITEQVHAEYSNIPERFVIALTEYAENRRSPGHFVHALLSNDLQGAFAHADEEAREHLLSMVRFVYNVLPGNIHGSRKIVQDWLCPGQWEITRPINGISINGTESVLDDNGDVMVFGTKEEAEEFLLGQVTDGETLEQLWDENGITVRKVVD